MLGALVDSSLVHPGESMIAQGISSEQGLRWSLRDPGLRVEGTSLGLALEPLNLKVAVVEAVARGAAQQPSFDDRSTALSRSSQRMFQAMGLWSEIDAASTPISSIHISDKGRFGFAHIDAAEQQVEALGHVVINRVLGEVLQKSLANTSGLDLICPGRISAVTLSDDRAEVTVDEEQETIQLIEKGV